jgi:plastocyanin
MFMRIAALCLLTAITVTAVACGDDDDDDAGGDDSAGKARPVEVVAADFAFAPDSIDAEPGETIALTFVNNDDTEHSFTIDDGVVDVEAEGGESADGEFTVPDGGTEFYCRYHETNMRGTIGTADASSGGDAGVGY